MDEISNGNGNGHRPESNQLYRQDFGGTSLSRDNQATASMVAKARAEIEARYVMALRKPRNMDQVRTDLMKECRRPNFAAVAIYHKPVGEGVDGFSIRFAEAAIRCFGNCAMEVSQNYDDENLRIMRVSATDLESNIIWPMEVTIEKTVERKFLRKGQRSLGSRMNSKDELVHTVEATEDDMLSKQGALVSKALRTCILRIIPGHLQYEAWDTCVAILKDKAAANPDLERNRVCDAFADQGIQPVNLEEWLGHTLSVATPVEIEHLRRLYVGIRDGEVTWADALAHRAEQLASKAPPKTAFDVAKEKVEAKAEAKGGTAAVKETIKKRSASKADPQQPLPTTEASPAANSGPTPEPVVKESQPDPGPGWSGDPDGPK